MRKIRVLQFILLFQCCIASEKSNETIPLPSTTVQNGARIMAGVTVSTIGLNTKILLALTSTATIKIHVTSHSHYTLLTYQSSPASIQQTSSKDLTYSTNIVPLKSHPTLPQTSTQKSPHTPTSIKPGKKSILHKVGLIAGVVSGLIILSLCLIVFHKKEARIRCLKLLCKPCTKNYSRYNIVPIYVYDDNEQDIRELQDDSDLPLV